MRVVFQQEKVPAAEIFKWVQKQAELSAFTETEVMYCVWDGIVTDVDASRKAHQRRPALLNSLSVYSASTFDDICT